MNDPVCGRPPNANRRVLDGEPAGFGSFPWQALIRVGKGKNSKGTILHLDNNVHMFFFTLLNKKKVNVEECL